MIYFSPCVSDRGRYAGTCWHRPTSPRGGAHAPGRHFPRWCAPTAEAGACRWSGEEAGTPPRARWQTWRKWPKLCSGDDRSRDCNHGVVCFRILFNIHCGFLLWQRTEAIQRTAWAEGRGNSLHTNQLISSTTNPVAHKLELVADVVVWFC